MSLTLQPEDPRLMGDFWDSFPEESDYESDEFDDYDEDDDFIE